MKKQLKRTKQCQKCPWKKATDPNTIPNGYSQSKHRGLRQTIADPGALSLSAPAMACHESDVGEEAHCIGWLMHQLGPGNNIGLRIAMMKYDLSQVHLDGEQHETFEDTLP
jgi:hypothetical protein